MAKVIRYTKYGYEIYDTETLSYKMLDSEYTDVSDFINGYAKIAINGGGSGYINELGEEVVSAMTTSIDMYNKYIFVAGNQFIINTKEGRRYFVDLERQYGEKDYVHYVGEGVFEVRYVSSPLGLRIYKKKHYKLNGNGKFDPFLQNQNSDITFLSNYSNACALIHEQKKYKVQGSYLPSYSHSFVFIDKEGNELCRLQPEETFLSHYIGAENIFLRLGSLVHIKDTIYKYIVSTGHSPFAQEEIFVDIGSNHDYGKYDYCDILEYDGLRRVYQRGFGWGYIDKHNTEVFACQYKRASPFVNKIAKVESKNYPYTHYIDIGGNRVEKLPLLYNLQYRQGFATFNIGKMKATIDRAGRNYCRCQNTELFISGFLAVDTFINGVAIAVDKTLRCGIIDIAGNRLSEFIYDNIYRDGEYLKTHIGRDKELLCSYDESQFIYNSKMGENKYGYLSNKGSLLIKCEYDQLSKIENGRARGYKDGKLYIIDIKTNTTSYYSFSNWLTNDFYKGLEVYVMQGGVFAFLSNEQKQLILNGIKSRQWRQYFSSLGKAVDDYIGNLDISKLLNDYQLELKHETTFFPGDKADFCDTYLMSNYKSNGDDFLNELLEYKETLFSMHDYTAHAHWDIWTRSKAYSDICESISSRTLAQQKYFKQNYTTEKHRKRIIKEVHNELRMKAIIWETNLWREAYLKFDKEYKK